MVTFDSEFLAGLSGELAAEVAALGVVTPLAAGEKLFDIGDDANRIFVVERGRINLTLPIHVEGQVENVLVEERLPGQMLGWSALVPPHRFTLRAMAPLETVVLAFRREALIEYFAAHPETAFVVTRNVATVVGHRLQVVQAMWLREVQRAVERRSMSLSQ